MLKKYKPNPRQLAFHQNESPWRWFCGGYGSGKTTTAVVEAFRLAYFTHPGYAGIVAAPTYKLLHQAWFAEWKMWIPKDCWEKKNTLDLGPHIILDTPYGESIIYMRSTSDPGSNEGINAAWLVFDEASLEKDKRAFEVLSARIRRGYPGRQRSIILTGPPQTKKHWTAVEFGYSTNDKFKGDDLSWSDGTRAVIRAKTADNPYLPPDYERNMRSRPGATKAWCEQWLEAKFGSVEGQIYQAFDKEVHVVPHSKVTTIPFKKVLSGVDWGFTHPGTALTCGLAGEDIYVINEEIHQGKVVSNSEEGWGPIFETIMREHKCTDFACDPSAPDKITILQLLCRKYGARAYAANNSVQDGINKITALLENTLERKRTGQLGKPCIFISDKCVHTISEFESYSRKKAKDGSVLDVPEEKGDDAMDGLRYAVVTLLKPFLGKV